MDDAYWNLFWMTGMPSAWVLSHGRSEVAPQRDGGAPEGLSGSTPFPGGPLGGIPGNPERPY